MMKKQLSLILICSSLISSSALAIDCNRLSSEAEFNYSAYNALGKSSATLAQNEQFEKSETSLKTQNIILDRLAKLAQVYQAFCK